MVKKVLKTFISNLLPVSHYSNNTYLKTLEELYNSKNANVAYEDVTSSISIVIFSKDRAIQLHALLSSFFELVKGNAAITVLYTASTNEHSESYNTLKPLFQNKDVVFIKETNFREDLIKTLHKISEEKLMFLVDDIVFKETLDLTDFCKYNTSRFVPTLRMGQNLTYAYTMQMQQQQPKFISDLLPDKDKLVWRWQDGQLDWSYPLSVDGHLFNTEEIKIIIRNSEFKAPNSLEESLQLFNPIFKNRYGLAMRKSVIMNIPNNKVQVENKNHSGGVSVDDLLEKWQEGYQIDFQRLRHFENYSAHQEVNLEFKKLDTYRG